MKAGGKIYDKRVLATSYENAELKAIRKIMGKGFKRDEIYVLFVNLIPPFD